MKVSVGDKVRIVNAPKNQGEYNNGDVLEVEAVNERFRRIKAFGVTRLIFFSEFRVIEINGDIETRDMVNQPNHYTQGKVECIDAIEAAVTGLVGMEAVNTGHVIRYIWRWKHKNGLEDLEKGRFYLDKLIEEVRQGEQTKV